MMGSSHNINKKPRDIQEGRLAPPEIFNSSPTIRKRTKAGTKPWPSQSRLRRPASGQPRPDQSRGPMGARRTTTPRGAIRKASIRLDANPESRAIDLVEVDPTQDVADATVKIGRAHV